jgi:hypothetical protein
MKKKRLDKKTAIETPASGTTVLINYSTSRSILEVEFRGGRVYHYKKVERPKWEEYETIVLSGGSSGIFVNTKIKPFYEAEEII